MMKQNDKFTKYIIQEKPSIKETYRLIDEGLRKKALIVISSYCSADYHGRAKSRLGFGDRLMVIKSDGSFLIHQDRGVEPVNWQPPGSKCRVMIKDDRVFVESSRRKPHERLEVEIKKAYFVSYQLCHDIHELEVAGHEEDMCSLIFESPDIIEKGFRPMAKEYATSNGFVDILGKDKNGLLVILELKSRKAGVSAVRQLRRYINDFKDDRHGVRGIIVAPSITHDALELLKEEGLEFRSLEPPRELRRKSEVTLDNF